MTEYACGGVHPPQKNTPFEFRQALRKMFQVKSSLPSTVFASRVQSVIDENAFQKRLAFLRQHFVLLDPITEKSSEVDEETLRQARVILMGGVHRSKTLYKIQQQFIQLFITKDDCLLMEGLTLDEKLSVQQLKELNIGPYRNLRQGVTLLGADIRSFTKASDYYLRIRYMDNFIKWEDLGFAYIFKVIDILNIALTRGSLIFNRNRMTGISAFDEIIYEGDRLCSIQDSLEKKQLELPQFSQEELNRTRLPIDLGLAKSNLALTQQIVEKVSLFRKVFAIWGLGHFCDDLLVKKLEQLHIPFLILMPNKKEIKSAMANIHTGDEHTGDEQNEYRFFMGRLRGKEDQDFVFSLKKHFFYKRFLPQIQNGYFHACPRVDIDLVEMGKQKKNFTLPSMNRVFFKKGYSYNYNFNTRDIELFLGVTEKCTGPIIDDADYFGTDEYFMVSPKPFEIVPKSTPHIILPNPHMLFLQMIRQGINTLEVTPEQWIIFYGLTNEEMQQFEKKPYVIKWLKSYAYKRFPVTFLSSETLSFKYTIEQDPKGNTVALRCEQKYKICIHNE